jgi:hypothetical protein
MRFGSFSGGKDAEISQGQEFQCDCPKKRLSLHALG